MHTEESRKTDKTERIYCTLGTKYKLRIKTVSRLPFNNMSSKAYGVSRSHFFAVSFISATLALFNNYPAKSRGILSDDIPRD